MLALALELAVDTSNILWSDFFKMYHKLNELNMNLFFDIFQTSQLSYSMKVDIEEDDTRIYVDIGYGGYVS